MLRCADGSFYVGSTWNLEHRLYEHEIGEGAEYTKRRRPVELVWVEEYERVADAFAREKQVQNWSRVKRQALIDRCYADLPALAERYSTRRRREREIAEAERRGRLGLPPSVPGVPGLDSR